MVLYSYKKEDESDKRTVADLRTDGRTQVLRWKYFHRHMLCVVCLFMQSLEIRIPSSLFALFNS